MTDHEVQVLAAAEVRAAHTLFRAAMHHPPASDEQWEHSQRAYVPGRTLGVRSGDLLVGTTTSFPAPLTVPGRTGVPHAGVTRVGVRADHTRRGVVTELMRSQLRDLAERGEVLASLRASEAAIYGRFGYGVASRGRDLAVRTARAKLHPCAPVTGEVRLLAPEELETLLPSVYHGLDRSRPGWQERSEHYWSLALARHRGGDEYLVGAVHTGPAGPDGYVVYTTGRNERGRYLEIRDLHADNPGAQAGLWRFLLGVDLAVEVVTDDPLAMDLPLEALLTDRDAVRTTGVTDEIWLRLIDVPAALAARTYGAAEPVVLSVRDRFLPGNTGHYLISPDGVARTEAAAQLELDADVLAMIYLGDSRPSQLAAAGRVTVTTPEALAEADRLFASDRVPWSGTFF
ncbi:GNAT family N-acetyltransferase [Crossiella sp. SN42]|uniref:GNAT family N-acetyltransferase n=1 Tax=Crossiella sp. SN42 TaxID=2944808 RepID=UPI00207CFE7A|nr:GNAT family N-acetyltransferase [Crossiella sp. SN42]MCO1580689.1 GNAT family N-acetyltransferase [Crossiella sp. SN42]